MTQRPRRRVWLIVDHDCVGVVDSAWPFLRLLRRLQSHYPNAHTHEVTTKPVPFVLNKLDMLAKDPNHA
jgi:hypothetical protein